MASLLMSQISQLLVSHHYNLHCAKKKKGKEKGLDPMPPLQHVKGPVPRW